MQARNMLERARIFVLINSIVNKEQRINEQYSDVGTPQVLESLNKILS